MGATCESCHDGITEACAHCNLGNRDLAPTYVGDSLHPNWILGSTSDKHNAPNWQPMLSLDNVDMGCNGIRDAFQGGANHMGSRMPSGQAKEDAACLGTVERSTLPRKVRQTQEPIGTRRHIGGIMRHNRICIGATVALGLYGVAIQLLAQLRCEHTRRIGPRADPVSSGNDKRP